MHAARQEKPDLILLDIMMPEMSGYDFIKAYRKESETPVILLTAKLDETDKVLGLELGADDYVTKPFGMKELVARINAVLVDGKPANLTPSEFDLLCVLMSTSATCAPRSSKTRPILNTSKRCLGLDINFTLGKINFVQRQP